MATHNAVVTVGLKAPLEIRQVPTTPPTKGEVRVRVEWTASTPLDLHQNDGGLLVKHPQILGDGTAGTVVEIGPGVNNLKVGDKVFGFTFREQKEKAHQEFCTSLETNFGKVPEGFTLQEAITLPNNFVTVFHAVTTDFELPLPWPKPAGYVPPHSQDPILIWGGSSSVGQFALQILKYYGYQKLITTSSKRHHEFLKSLGASETFDYNDADVSSAILNSATKGSSGPAISFILDCIGSQDGSIRPIAKIAQKDTKVAILLPVVVKDSSETTAPEYSMDVQTAAKWEAGVDVRGVRTHFYANNEFFRDHLQTEVMPTMLKEGIVTPNKQRIIEGNTLLERAQKAMDIMRRKEQSGERLVWRVSE
ncbi:GroES-like protein [Mytilinidion resinicola]|uniref:GroES-like protein n=1 Tax=Mytilinidion resinicola TaxID=574789 RepID=A0A6A6Z2R2_9PEZI|nr:GroES-like protein [Mytilinidion resinicola]KAF2815411.1 GroES-like protein [Mytilinidion resinicola]